MSDNVTWFDSLGNLWQSDGITVTVVAPSGKVVEANTEDKP